MLKWTGRIWTPAPTEDVIRYSSFFSEMQTYQDAINALLQQSVILPPEVIAKVINFIEENKDVGFTNKEDFVRDAIRYRLERLKNDNEFVEVSREQ